MKHSQTGRRAGTPIHRRREHYRVIWRVLAGRAPTHRKAIP